MTLESLQHKARWIMAPANAVMAFFTPQRWAGAITRFAYWLGRVLVIRTSGLARFINKLQSPLLKVRNALLARSPVLAAIDWKVRQTFWCLVWGGVVGLVRSPRRSPIPRVELPIRVLQAPQTFKEFSAPVLVVPSSPPLAEVSLATDVSVQGIHLLQDIYPIVAPHQKPASADPQERFRKAYPGIYRLLRKAPVWHPDLIAASQQGNLLGALAAGGPFAKLLQRDSAAGGYSIDLLHMDNYPVREGLVRLGNKIHLTAPGGALQVTGVETGGGFVTPGEPGWDMAERIALAALVTHTTVWRQGMEYHVGGLAPVPILVHDYLPPDNPLRRLLAPHMNMTMLTNVSTHLTLTRSGFDVFGFSFPYTTLMGFFDDGAASFDIRRLDVTTDAVDRGIPEDLHYPWLPQARRYWNLWESYVSAYLDLYYPDDAVLGADKDAHVWFEAMDRFLIRGIRSYVPTLTKANLVKLCTVLIYSLALGHTENSLFNYAAFLPTTVHADGTQQTLGEVQCTINFQFLITARTTLLLDRVAHVALDEAGAEVMRQYQRSLVDLENEFAAQESRYWHLRPSELEAAVSA